MRGHQGFTLQMKVGKNNHEKDELYLVEIYWFITNTLVEPSINQLAKFYSSYFLGFELIQRFARRPCSRCIFEEYNLALNKYEGYLASKLISVTTMEKRRKYIEFHAEIYS